MKKLLFVFALSLLIASSFGQTVIKDGLAIGNDEAVGSRVVPVDSVTINAGMITNYVSGDTMTHVDAYANQLQLSSVAVLKADSSGVTGGKYVTGNDFEVARKYTLKFDGGTTPTPLDNTLYYFGGFGSSGMSTTVNARRYLIPNNCTVIGYAICTKSSAASTSETSTLSLRINNTTDVQLNNALVYTNAVNCYYSMALSTNLTAGDYIEFKLLTATWVTDATSLGCDVTLYLKTR